MSKTTDKSTALATPAQRGTVDLGITFSIPAGKLPGRDEGALLSELWEEAKDATVRMLRFGWAALKIKESLPHGQWGTWLKEHCPDLAERTVQHHMKLCSIALPQWSEVDSWEQVDASKFAGSTAKALLGLEKDKTSTPKPAGGAAQGKAKEASEDAGHDALAAHTDETVRGLLSQLSAQILGGLDIATDHHLTNWLGTLTDLCAQVRDEAGRRSKA